MSSEGETGLEGRFGRPQLEFPLPSLLGTWRFQAQALCSALNRQSDGQGGRQWPPCPCPGHCPGPGWRRDSKTTRCGRHGPLLSHGLPMTPVPHIFYLPPYHSIWLLNPATWQEKININPASPPLWNSKQSDGFQGQGLDFRIGGEGGAVGGRMMCSARIGALGVRDWSIRLFGSSGSVFLLVHLQLQPGRGGLWLFHTPY